MTPRALPPVQCPHCGAGPASLQKRGSRRRKFGRTQLWRCVSCERIFTPGSPALAGKTFPPNVILEALMHYCRGASLTQTAARLKSRFGVTVAPATISTWLSEHDALIPYRRLRDGVART